MENYSYIILSNISLSLIISIFLIKFWKFISLKGIDPSTGIQKIHDSDALRIGSIAVILSFLIIGISFNLIDFILFK